MERNPGDNFGTSAGQGDASGADLESDGGSQFGSASQQGSFGSTGGASTQGSTLRESGRDRLGRAKEKANEVKATLADKLDAGAQRLQQRSGGSGTTAGATADGSTAALTTSKASEKVATGMRNTADWLRNNDLDTMRQSIEKEVRTNPGRSLLVAAVAGYLLGKTFRR